VRIGDHEREATGSGAGIQQWAYTGAANQRWTLTAVS
jgi:hypothetical protein